MMAVVLAARAVKSSRPQPHVPLFTRGEARASDGRGVID